MINFISIVWDPTDSESRGSAELIRNAVHKEMSDWTCTLQADGLTFFHAPLGLPDITVCTLPHDQGVVLGHLFPSSLTCEAPHRPIAIDDRAAARYLRSRGEQFARDYWGAYVAFFNDFAGNRRLVLRDVSGRIPCFRTRSGAAHVLFSDINDVIRLPGISLSINWDYINAFLFYEQLQVRESGFREVTEILGGEALEFRGLNVTQRVLWNPNDFARQHYREGREDSLAELRFVVQQCVARWASVYRSILHSLSGGIDSSIVLACVSKAPSRPRITCLNRFTEAPGEDERAFARLSAEHAGTRLIERDWRLGTARFDHVLPALRPTAKPSISVVGNTLDMGVRNEIAAEAQAESTWTGQGGDHLFLQDRSTCGATDFARLRGLRPGILSAISDAALLSGQSYWSIARAVLSNLGSARHWQPTHVTQREPLFTRDIRPVAELVEFISHPWTWDNSDLAEGKQSQIWLLAEAVNRHRPPATTEFAPELHPLLSQPLMELCVRLPTYTLLSGGRPRGLARDAFDGLVPAQILQRRTKGGTTSFWMSSVAESRDYLDSLLLKGWLHREGMIDAELVVPWLRPDVVIPVALFPRLVASISAEMWLRSWHADADRPSA